MGIRERQSRERDTVRQKIVDAARGLFLTEGYANVSMRKIADRIEYSPGAIYSYFASKEDIFFVLAEEGMQEVRAHCSAADAGDSAYDRVREALWRFYTFSRQQPGYFSLIFVDSAVPRLSRDWERFGAMRALRHEIEQDLQQLIDDGVFPQADSAASIFRILWTAVYGAAVFRLSHRMAPGEDADALAQDLLDAVLAGLRGGLAPRFHASLEQGEAIEPEEVRSHAP
jgi:AcrR family transcriptional regulator